ncbi:hypothetical protein BJI67_08120 [Acidihalobacter aeolianus]|uniref:Uncharacterized protein n=1 Tax=Acidihalobacter aeolianus TaxID=2792603 RepID=A0A1D8K7T2_9GAMM|nr:hypothetical protein [Acidihalobacter aeolianus]AOV17027.1 hypothetical protein BJI67_08120 [Acidihalobacter aeolianus]
MVLNDYKNDNLLFNSNFLEETSTPGLSAYRGDLVIVDGGLDDKGHPNPPQEILRGAILLADDKLHLLVGSLDRIDMMPRLLDRFEKDFASDLCMMLFVVNAKDRAIYEIGNTKAAIIPLVQGVCWNEAIDELALEKSDFKGQSPGDKIKTLYQEMKSYQAKGSVRSLDELLEAVTDVKREAWGAV